MGKLEAALAAIEGEIAAAQKNAEELGAALKRARKAAASGRIADIEKALASLPERARAAADSADVLAAGWSFDVRGYLENGGYAREVLEQARVADLKLLERDGRLYAFPLAIRLMPSEAALRVGKKTQRDLRPSTLAKALAAIQKKPLRFSEQRFLEILYRTYERMAGRDWRRLEKGMGDPIPLVDIHAVLTLLPGVDYPVEEFGRDLLLLDRKPDLRTREGYGFRFAGAAMSRERPPIKVYDEEGRERSYLGLAFVKEA